MKKSLDYHMILQAISSYLVGAKDFFGKVKKKDFSIGLIPDGHHIYTGTLKALGYFLLKKSDTLILIGEGAINNKVSVLGNLGEVFMGKKWGISKKVLDILEKSDLVEVVGHKFDRISSELPFIRIISDYKNLVFLEIGDNLSKIKTINLLQKVSRYGNVLFISDLHTDKDIKSCKKLDSKIMDLSFVSKNNKLFLVELFLRLSKKASKNVYMMGYLNTGEISTDKKNTSGFGCLIS